MPKVFVPLFPSFTIWDAMHDALSCVCDRIVLVLSPGGSRFVAHNRGDFGSGSFARTELACQEEPLGMGDAIFGAVERWRDADNLLVVWGDQFNLSAETVRRCLAIQSAMKAPAFTLPLVRMDRPYVQYVFDAEKRLTEVRQSREGDTCEPNGFADMGVFLLTGGKRLLDEWHRYRAATPIASMTGESNFLPFLVHLSSVAKWPVGCCECHDGQEALGINTPEDLALARRILRERNPARFADGNP